MAPFIRDKVKSDSIVYSGFNFDLTHFYALEFRFYHINNSESFIDKYHRMY